MEKTKAIRLLRSIIEGKPLAECWKMAGYSSMENAIEDIEFLIGLAEKLEARSANSESEPVVVYVDGGSRGNPGPSAAAAVAYFQDGSKAGTRKLYLGKRTNNEAEYIAVIEGLKLAKTLGAKKVLLRLDSELIHRQIIRRYRVKSDRLMALFNQVEKLKGGFEEVLFEHISRDKNTEADKIVNSVLDGTADSDGP